ncbi:MAG: hypothetical protein ACXVB9_06170 [Bdellovibrionota bacterium]
MRKILILNRLLSHLSVVGLSAFGMLLGHWIAHHDSLILPASAADGDSSVTRTRQFELVDAKGQRRALIGFSGEGSPAIWFFDESGTPRLNLGIYGDGNPMIVLNDKNGQAVQIFRSVGGESDPVLVMKADGRDRIVLGLDGKKEPYLATYNSAGIRHAVLGN